MRLSKPWLEGLLEDGLTDSAYVEIVGVLTTVLSVDDLHRGLGLDLEPLPAPVGGEPARRRPSGATGEGASGRRARALWDERHLVSPRFAVLLLGADVERDRAA